MAAPSSASPKPPTSIPALQRIFTSTADSQVAHINRLLSTASGIDSALLFIGYALTFVSAQFKKASTLPSPRLAIIERTFQLVSGSNSPTIARPASSQDFQKSMSSISDSTKTFGGLCSDVRMFMRLWGLFKIYAGAKATYSAPPKDGTLKALAWAQLASMGAYLGIEHVFYLTTKGVLKGIPLERALGWFKIAIWLFGGYLVMDFVKLWHTWQLREHERKMEALVPNEEGGDAEREAIIQREKQDAAWWRSLQVSMAYSPLCLHWVGIQMAALDDTWVGLLGAWAGWVGIKEAWRVTA